MTSTFHHIALIGKYHTPAAGVPSDAASEALQRIAGYVRSLGCEVILDTQSAIYAGLPKEERVRRARALLARMFAQQRMVKLAAVGQALVEGVGFDARLGVGVAGKAPDRAACIAHA